MSQAVLLQPPPSASLLRRFSWGRLSLSLRFSITASIVVAIGMAVIGSWVSSRIEDGVIKNASTLADDYVHDFIAPHLQELAVGPDISDEHKQALDQLLSPHATRKPILFFRIWQGNTVVYSNQKEDIGKAFPETEALARAWKGSVVGEFDHTTEEHRSKSIPPNLPILEIYAPVRSADNSRIIALAETYEMAGELKNELTTVKFQSWLFVGFVTLAIIGSLFGIVHNGSRTIDQQRASLEQRIAELSRLL